MKLSEARSILNQVDGFSASYIKAWGPGWVKEAIRTIRDRKGATSADRNKADRIADKLRRNW